MKYTDCDVLKAVEIAVIAHHEQVDRGLKPYILHLLKVMFMANDNVEKIVAVLHDLIEDCEWTFEMLQDEGFEDDVIGPLRLLTKEKGITYKDYIERLKKNPISRQVKIYDLIDNMDLSRLTKIKNPDLMLYTKYQEAYVALTGEYAFDSKTIVKYISHDSIAVFKNGHIDNNQKPLGCFIRCIGKNGYCGIKNLEDNTEIRSFIDAFECLNWLHGRIIF